MAKTISVGGRPTQPGHSGSASKGSAPSRQPSSTSEPGAGAAAKISPSKSTRTPSAKGKKK